MKKFKKLAIIGSILIVASIIIGVILEHDIAFLLCGAGIIIIAIAILTYVNK